MSQEGPGGDAPAEEPAQPSYATVGGPPEATTTQEEGQDGLLPETADAAGADGEGKVVHRKKKDGSKEMIRRLTSKTIMDDMAARRRTQSIESMTVVDDSEQKLAAEEANARRLPIDYFYADDDPQLVPKLEEGELPRECTKPLKFAGFDFRRLYNLVWTSDTEFAYITGHVVIFKDIATGEERKLHGRDTGGIGAVAMSVDGKYLAVAEKSVASASPPNVYIYQYKNMKLYRILRKGTERGYAAVQFSPHNKGMHLAALGRLPDYLLSVWDWRNERMLLKCKAYGQDVYSVRWGQFPGMLTTCGTGHIRFWKMATTFTGLKLQGDIGKFGATELSDVVGFVELPDGKVVTGSEYGRLLLWEGVFVKVELMRGTQEDPREIEQLPHTGAIEVIMMDAGTECVVSGGDDGYLRWWPIPEIDEAEADYDLGILEYGISMQKEVRIPLNPDHPPAHIVHVVWNHSDGIWLVQDVRNGVVWMYDRDAVSCDKVIQGHSGPVTGALVFSNYPGLVVSSGTDGTLRALNMTADSNLEVFSDRRTATGSVLADDSKAVGITCIAAVPEAVDPERRMLCCGYENGVIRALSVCRDGFILLQAQKPHNVSVEQLEYSPTGGFLASVGSDNTVFLFEVRGMEDHLLSIGFVQMHCKVNHIIWHVAGRLLLSLQDGTIVELLKPQIDLLDNSESYLIQLDYRAIAPELPEPEESESEGEEGEGEEGEGGDGAENAGGGDGEEGAKETKEERKERKRKEKDERARAQKGDDDDEEGDAKQEESSEVLRSIYIPVSEEDSEEEDVILFVGTGVYAGGLWSLPVSAAEVISCEEVEIGQHMPTQLMATLYTKLPAVPVTHMSVSPTQRFIFIGFQDGTVWTLPFMNFNVHQILSIGDSTSGAITSISCDPAENMMVVGGSDGTLSSVALNSDALVEAAEVAVAGEDVGSKDFADQIEASMPTLKPQDADSWDLPFTDSPGFVVIARDITDPKQYSIQDAKLKAEEDNAKAAAEQKKRRVHDKIAELRRELEDLLAKNETMPCNKLTTSDTAIDVDYIDFLNKDMELKVQEVSRELAWAVEFHELGVQKLQDYYLGRLDFERVEVLAFQSPHRVATFRCPKMSSELQANLARLHDLICAGVLQTDEEEDDDDMQEEGGEKGETRGGGTHALRHGTTKGEHEWTDGMGSTSQAPISGAELREMRRQQRQERKQQKLELEKAKPSDTYEDPRDVEAIAHAEATLGNYMLKTSDSYQVPENQRMNAEKKRRQMFLLEESMHAIKTEFNHRVLALRDFRQQVRQEVKRDLAALIEIDQQLGTTTDWITGLLDDPPGAPKEFPERRFEITEADLKAFVNELKGGPAVEAEDPSEVEEEEDDAEQDEELQWDGEEDEEGEGVKKGDAKGRGEDQGRASGRRASKEEKSQHAASGHAALAARRIARLTTRATILQESPLPLGKAVFEEARARLWHDKAQLEEHIRQVIDTFNSAVASLEKEKAKLESDLKNADMKLLVLYEELLTLNELEERDEALLKKAATCRQEKTKIMHQIKECQEKLGEKKAEIEQWHVEEQQLQAEFTELVGENSAHLSALLKVYKKKMKRSKRKKAGEDEDMDDDDEDDEDESDLESDEEDDDMEEDVGPPPGCDVQIYESVIDLRDKRLELEDALQDIQKDVEELKRTHKNHLADEKKIDKMQKDTASEIQQFQTDKQRKLNQVQIVFALRLSQVQCLDELDDIIYRLPAELKHHVVFTHEGLQKLMSRITELHQEIKEVKANFRQLQRDFQMRKKDKNQAMQHIEELQSKFQDIQMLKFGQMVDLELIDGNAPSKYVLELQQKVAEAEKEQRRRLAEWEKRIEKQKKELTKVTSDNTSLMDQIVSMGYSQMQLDAALNARIANVTVNDTEPLIELRELERERLKDLLTLQSKEIATLQAEINLFRRKGGHIYTTVTANRT